MDRSRVKAIVDANIRPLKQALGIPHWHVRFEYKAIP